VNKTEFELQKQLLWVYMRHEGKCTACGHEVNPREVATDRDIVRPLDIDDLLEVRLMHPFCKAAAARRARQLSAAA
jgi:hypothetical protein